MPRPPRIHLTGALYYVTYAAAESATLFRDETDYATYLELLRACRERFAFKLYSYVLLPDQIHLCVELTADDTLSSIMHALSSRYTKHVAKRYGHTGPLFQRRFTSTILEKAPWLLQVTGYLHTLPRRVGVAASGLAGYRWSSYPAYLLTRGPSELSPMAFGEVKEVVDLVSLGHPGDTYAQSLERVTDAEWQEMGRQLKRHILGSPEFVSMVEQRSAPGVARPQQSVVEPTRPAAQPGPRPAHHTSTPPLRAGSTLAMTASICAVVLALGAAWVYAQNLVAVRQLAQALMQELRLSSLVSSEGRAAGARLASFAPASPDHPNGLIRSTGLNGTAWAIALQSTSDGAGVRQADHLRFERNMVASSQLSAKGFVPTNYTVKFRADGALLWETTQTAPDGSVARWYGKWQGEMMHGVMVYQVPGQSAVSYEFVGATHTKET